MEGMQNFIKPLFLTILRYDVLGVILSVRGIIDRFQVLSQVLFLHCPCTITMCRGNGLFRYAKQRFFTIAFLVRRYL